MIYKNRNDYLKEITEKTQKPLKFTKAPVPQSGYKDRCIFTVNSLNIPYRAKQILIEFMQDLEQVKELYNKNAYLYGFEKFWYDRTATIDDWEGNRLITFTTYEGETITTRPTHRNVKTSNRPSPTELVSFLYLFILHEQKQISIDYELVKCSHCNETYIINTHCPYCESMIDDRTISINDKRINYRF